MSKIQANQIQHTQNGAAVFTLPTSDGTDGQVLKTNGSGVLSFGADQGGKILQVVNTTYNGKTTIGLTNAYGNNSSNIYYYTQLDTTITTTSANSKILISGSSSGEFTSDNHLFGYVMASTIGGTTAPIDSLRAAKDSNANRPRLSFLPCINYHGSDNDSTPATTPFSNLYYAPNQAAGTAITIRLGITTNYHSNQTFYANQIVSSVNSSEYEHSVSHMTLMEVS